MPTTKPRYTFTDTGELAALLDLAQRRWPDVTDRKALFIRLLEEGASALDEDRAAAEERSARAREALTRIPSLVDAEVLLSDQAWR